MTVWRRGTELVDLEVFPCPGISHHGNTGMPPGLEHAWRFEARGARTKLSRFNELVGRMRAESATKKSIAAEVDRQGFKLKELEKKDWELLAEYNQRNPRKAIRTFSDALEHRHLRWNLSAEKRTLPLRGAVLKRFRRAYEKWKKAQPESQGC